jgi:hypothetical protein
MVTIRWCYGATLLRERHPTTWNDFVVHHSIYGRSTYDMARIAQCAIQHSGRAGRRLRLGIDPGRQCPIRLTEGDLIVIRAKSVEKNRIR